MLPSLGALDTVNSTAATRGQAHSAHMSFLRCSKLFRAPTSWQGHLLDHLSATTRTVAERTQIRTLAAAATKEVKTDGQAAAKVTSTYCRLPNVHGDLGAEGHLGQREALQCFTLRDLSLSPSKSAGKGSRVSVEGCQSALWERQHNEDERCPDKSVSTTDTGMQRTLSLCMGMMSQGMSPVNILG